MRSEPSFVPAPAVIDGGRFDAVIFGTGGVISGTARVREAESDPHAVALVRRLQEAGIATAIISASGNAEAVLASAGMLDLFPVRIDGVVADDKGLAGKPDPAVFLEAAHQLGVDPSRAVVVEGSQAGVQAGKDGGFGLVIGVGRGGQAGELRAGGADVVVTDLGKVRVTCGAGSATPSADARHPMVRPIDSLPLALEAWARIVARLDDLLPIVFLDYDGTLTPIVERPEDAHLEESTRVVLARLAALCPVFVVSGRDVSFIVEEVGLGELWYMGSHGFEVLAPQGNPQSIGLEAVFEEYLAPLDDAEAHLREALGGVSGAQVERKKYALAVHYRRVSADDVPVVEGALDAELERQPSLRKSSGKRVFELRPDVDWHKGRAVCWAIESLGAGEVGRLPIYVGDDVTDEDAFAALAGEGLTAVVGGGDRGTMAQFRLVDSGDVRRLLELLAEKLDAGTLDARR